MNSDWVFSINSDEKFHRSFEKELGLQLFEAREKTKIKSFEKLNFQIGLGLIPLNLQIVDDIAYGKVEFITPTSFGFPITIAWVSKNNKISLKNIHQIEITSEDIKFHWTNDFPLKEIEKHITPYRKTKSQKNGLNFNVEYYYNLFPDIEFELTTNESLTKNEKDLLNNSLNDFWDNWNSTKKGKEIEAISNITQIEENYYCIVFDFGLKNTTRILTKILEVINLNCPNKFEIVKVK